MSTIIILTPIIMGGGWPVITAAVAGAATALGFTATEHVQQMLNEHHNIQQLQATQQVEIELGNSETLAKNLNTDQQITLTKDNVEIIIKRDERGRCSVCAKGIGKTKAELKLIAEEFTQKVTQYFIYDKVMNEVKNKNFQIVNEEVAQDDSIRIHVRRWVE